MYLYLLRYEVSFDDDVQAMAEGGLLEEVVEVEALKETLEEQSLVEEYFRLTIFLQQLCPPTFCSSHY